jgi:hypothetical protein
MGSKYCLLESEQYMSYRGPMLITEPELRWPIVVLTAIVTAVIALLAGALYSLALTQPYVNP